MKRAALVLAVGAILLFAALRARRESPARPVQVRLPEPAVVELSTPAVEVEEPARIPETPDPVPDTRRTVIPETIVDVPPPRPAEAATSVWGVVTLDGHRPSRKRARMDADPKCAGLHADAPLSDDFVVDAENRVRWAVAHVVKGLGDRRFEPPKVPVQLEQVGCRYVPHVLAARVDQPVAFVNRDPLLHNVHGLPFGNAEFNFGQSGPAEHVRAFARPEIFSVRCDVHPWMSAWLAVFDHPHFAVTDEKGRFFISGLPPGRYEIAIWHEQLKTEIREVDVGDVDVRLDFLLRRR